MTDGKRALIIGGSGSGKSQLAKTKIVPKLDRLVIFDPEHEYDKVPGVKAVHKRGLLDVLQQNGGGKFKVAYQPNRAELAGVGHPIIRELDQVSMLVLQLGDELLARGLDLPFTVLVDELHMGDPLHKPGGFEFFDWLCRTGRKRGISVIGITQAPADIGTSLRKNLDRVTVFSLSMPTDWKAAREITGTDVQGALKGAAKYARFEHLSGEGGKVIP